MDILALSLIDCCFVTRAGDDFKPGRTDRAVVVVVVCSFFVYIQVLNLTLLTAFTLFAKITFLLLLFCPSNTISECIPAFRISHFNLFYCVVVLKAGCCLGIKSKKCIYLTIKCWNLDKTLWGDHLVDGFN